MTIEILPIHSAIQEMLADIGVDVSMDSYAADDEWAANLPWDCIDVVGQ